MAANETFLREGYLGTSMDAIAARAAVSKQTVYKHFADKQTLFFELVTSTVDAISEPNAKEVVGLGDSEDLESDLRALARRQLARVMQPEVLQLRRLVIGEAGRFPELGRFFYERGPGRTVDALAVAFARLSKRGLLATADAKLAAAHFNWLVMSIPLNQAMLLGDSDSDSDSDSDGERPSARRLDGYADAGVRVFLAAYAAV